MNQLKFKTRLITAASSVVYGQQGLATDNESTNKRLEQMSVHKVDLTSSGAGVATISFDSGNGPNGAETQNAGTVASYYVPSVIAITVAISTADTNVILESSKG
jgi:hypothetical protein